MRTGLTEGVAANRGRVGIRVGQNQLKVADLDEVQIAINRTAEGRSGPSDCRQRHRPAACGVPDDAAGGEAVRVESADHLTGARQFKSPALDPQRTERRRAGCRHERDKREADSREVERNLRE